MPGNLPPFAGNPPFGAAKRVLGLLTRHANYPSQSAARVDSAEAACRGPLQHNLWVFGPEYSLMASNEQLQSIIREYTKQHYEGSDAKDRPDLFLAGNILKQHLLIEFKRPSVTVGRKAESQANEYADRLRPQNIAIDCWQEGANPIFSTRNSFPPKSHSIQQKYRRFCQPWGN